MKENFQFGGGATESVVNPLCIGVMFIAALLLMFLPRKYAIAPLLGMAFLIPSQEFVLGGLHLYLLRIVILVGLVRMMFSGRTGWDRIDTLFLLWALVRAGAFIAFYGEGAAALNQFGFLWDYLGGFFLVRFLIQDEDDIHRAVKSLAVIAMILSVFMLYERINATNLFGYLGGVRIIPEMRGAARSQGPFAHALLAGTFGATLVPLFAWLWRTGSKGLAFGGLIASTIMTVTANCSTPVLAYAAGVFGICIWRLRDKLGLFRWGAVIVTALLALVMKAPVWYLIARVDLVGGSSGYHRAMLIDQFIRHFSDWWLFGTNLNGTWGWDMWDTANQFVSEGETGGLLTLILFVAMLVLCFRRLGNTRRAQEDHEQEWFVWLLGVTLFAHIVGFFGIVYFDQTRIVWFLMLAAIATVTAPALTQHEEEEDELPVEATALELQ